jgi:hypothetical protein
MEGLMKFTQNFGQDNQFSGLDLHSELSRILLNRRVMYVTTAFVGKTSMAAVLTRGRKDSLVAMLKVQFRRLL